MGLLPFSKSANIVRRSHFLQPPRTKISPLFVFVFSLNRSHFRVRMELHIQYIKDLL